MPDNTSNVNNPSVEESNFQKVTFTEFLKISKWVTKVVFSIHPLYAGLSILFVFIDRIRILINSFILAKILDTMVKIATQPNANIKDIYPLLIIILLVNIFFEVVAFIDDYTSQALDIIMDPMSTKLLYQKINSLGIQALENPDIVNRIYRARRYLGSIHRYFNQIASFVSSVASLILSAILIAKNAPVVIPIMIIFSVPKIIINSVYRTRSWKFYYENTEKNRVANDNASDLSDTQSLQEIFINNAYAFFDKKFMDFSNWYTNITINIYKKWYMYTHSFNILGNIGVYFGV
jgi:hypothetical protein